MLPLKIGRLTISAVVERAGPTRPTFLFPDAAPEAVGRHRDWLGPHFIDARGRFLQSVHSFVVEGTANRDVWVLGTHFHAPTAGHVVREGAAWRFRV